jgi:hypothetical protein
VIPSSTIPFQFGRFTQAMGADATPSTETATEDGARHASWFAFDACEPACGMRGLLRGVLQKRQRQPLLGGSWADDGDSRTHTEEDGWPMVESGADPGVWFTSIVVHSRVQTMCVGVAKCRR